MPHVTYSLMALWVLIMPIIPVIGQENPQLNLSPEAGDIPNRVTIRMPAGHYKKLCDVRNKKPEFNKGTIEINGRENSFESLRIRGQSSLGFRRKSLNVKLDKKSVFRKNGQEKKLKEFYLIGMTMDQYYYRSYTSYTLLQHLGLFPMFFAYAEVVINGETQGVYMVVEKPHECLFDLGSACVIRRGYQHKIEEVKFEDKHTSLSEDDFVRAYEALYQLADEKKGRQLYDAWSDILNVRDYMRWLGFNFLIMNGDYADEVYLYGEPDSSKPRFGIVPWDYDDILAGSPHRRATPIMSSGWEGKYMFMGEEKLDRVIANDYVLHQMYLSRLRQVMADLGPDILRQVYEDVYRQLAPFYDQEEIIKMSAFDEDGEVTRTGFIKDFTASYQYLLGRRQWIELELSDN